MCITLCIIIEKIHKLTRLIDCRLDRVLEKFNKIISFLPSATEILFEIGLEKFVYGVTHECTFPPQAAKKSIVVRPVIDFDSLTAAQVDLKIKEFSSKGQPIFRLDEELIKQIQPDLLISQSTCSVCAPFEKEITKTINILGYCPKNLVLNPMNLPDILKSITTIGKEVGNLQNSIKLRKRLESKIRRIRTVFESTFPGRQEKTFSQRILCLDWINPFYLAGHWVPDMLAAAGGHTLNGISGMDSRQITISEIEKFDPDKIIIAPCGYDLERTQKEYELLTVPEWKSLRAFKNNQIYLVDSNSYFCKPSPRIITGIEILCSIIHPDTFGHKNIPDKSFKIADK